MDKALLGEVVKALDVMCDYFYQERTDEANRELWGVLPRLEQVISMISDEDVMGDIKNKLLEALQAMEEEDNVLFADIMKYEITDKLKEYL